MGKKLKTDEKLANKALKALDGIIDFEGNGRELLKKVRKIKYVPKAT